MPTLSAAALALALTLTVAGCASEGQGAGPGGPEDGEGGAVPPGARYVALGDSYTAAGGVPETVDPGCGRSSVNYPALVAEELGLELTDVSCGGAATTSLVGVQQTLDGPRPPQFQALTEDTELVTVGIGGNDENFLATLFATCLSARDTDPDGAPCREAMTASGTDVMEAALEVIETRLTSALVGVRGRAPRAEVVMVGYPQLVPAQGRCDELPLTAEDSDYVRGLFERLGAATEAAAAAADVRYVDVLAASEGHDVCAGEDAWVSGVRPTGRAEPVHPFAEEQEAVADLVLEVLED